MGSYLGFCRADDGIRTRDPHLGKVVLYQLSHVRVEPILLSEAGGAEPGLAPPGGGQLGHLGGLDGGVRNHHELGDPVALAHLDRTIRVEVDQGHHDLPAVALVDQARRVHQRQPLPRGQAGPREHQPRVPGWNRNRQPSGDHGPLPRPHLELAVRPQIQAGGAVLRNGVCPNGHPQRVERRLRERRRGRGLWVFLLLFLLVAGAAYAALVWYPRRAAGDLMDAPSERFGASLQAYRTTLSAFPPGATDPQALVAGCGAVTATSATTREQLANDTIALERQSPPDLPLVSSRPPLQQAVELRDLLFQFNTAAQEVLGRLEAVCGYVAQAAEVGGVQSALAATGGWIRGDRERSSGPAQAGGTPVVRALLGDIRSSF